ncbi:MAG TPA: hypothetical protein VNZ64_12170 [Candidatus Acidoferrum sp.]|jgi:hypothetical protein|nr:hypothetical protein [Candidatus Acidoferrum sp.]
MHRDDSKDSAVTLLYAENLAPSELNVIKIVEFLGGTVKAVKLTGELVRNPHALKSQVPAGGRLIARAHTLAKLAGENSQGEVLRAALTGLGASVLVYGFGQTPGGSEVLRALTAGSLAGVEPAPTAGQRIRVVSDARDICRQLSGLDFDAIGPGQQFIFVGSASQGAYSPLVSLGQRPFFVRPNAGHGRVFLLAGPEIADLDAEVPRGRSILQSLSSLAPVLMFLHGSSKNGFWHNETPAACFVLDDPLLRARYGFLDYQKLLALMERGGFSTSIAFIPWNFNRSSRPVAELLAANPRRYSLCVHGCDHTRGEFGATNYLLLRAKAQQALERMTLHRNLTGLDFDDVMVFPQGIFSTPALKALKTCGYLAAVNSSPYAVDADNRFTLGELLDVSVARSNFPLFLRRPADGLADLAFDLFLGKPALVVEHHGFFREGYDALAETVQELYRVERGLRWANLGTVCSRACLQKVAENGTIHVKFFTDRFSLRNETSLPKHYALFRRTPREQGATTVTVNDHRQDFGEEAGWLRTEVSLGPGQEARVVIQQGKPEPVAASAPQDGIYRARVFMRRHLCEFRDDYLDKSRLLSKSVRGLFGTGEAAAADWPTRAERGASSC